MDETARGVDQAAKHDFKLIFYLLDLLIVNVNVVFIYLFA